MSEPKDILDEIKTLLAPLAFESPHPAAVYPVITAKLAELRNLKVEESFLDLIDDSVQVVLRMKPGDECAAVSYVITEIEVWQKKNQFWFKHLE